MSMKEEKLKEAAKLNQLKYVFDNTLDNAKINELKTIGIGNFIDGANWMKEQMMKDAITADIGYYNQHGLSIYPEKSLEKLGFDEHDNVKIVVIKEE